MRKQDGRTYRPITQSKPETDILHLYWHEARTDLAHPRFCGVWQQGFLR